MLYNTPFTPQMNCLCVKTIYNSVCEVFIVFYTQKLCIFVYLWLVTHPIVFHEICVCVCECVYIYIHTYVCMYVRMLS